jgi:hypothetical protein
MFLESIKKSSFFLSINFKVSPFITPYLVYFEFNSDFFWNIKNFFTMKFV